MRKEIATAGCQAGNHLILSTATTSGVEEVTAARGAPVWYQLYATNKWEVARAMVLRAEKAGSPAVAVTIDRSGGRNQETLFRLMRSDTRNCDGCHDRSSLQANMKRRSMYEGLDLAGLTHTQSSAMTWDFLKRLRDTTKMKIVLKGILAHEDATRGEEWDGWHHRLQPRARTAAARPSTHCRRCAPPGA
jgi:isopentenyl diphosphate isomerase/L-lactate dehydrogenase-like FMN-dependent dehydrogenase